MAFIDLTKTIDSINREAFWNVFSRFGCPTYFIPILSLLHHKMTATVLINGTETEPFIIRAGMKQGCIIVPTLFTVYLRVVLFLLRDRLPCGVETDYRRSRRLFNLSRLKTKTKVTKTAVIYIQYGDDCAILAHIAEKASDKP